MYRPWWGRDRRQDGDAQPSEVRRRVRRDGAAGAPPVPAHPPGARRRRAAAAGSRRITGAAARTRMRRRSPPAHSGDRPAGWERWLIRYLGPFGQHNRYTLMTAGAAAVIELALLSSYLFTHGSWPTPDVLVVALLPVALIVGRPHWFLLDWGVLLCLWLVWQALAGAVRPQSFSEVHVTQLIVAERRLFDGIVPTIALQGAFFRLDHLAWWDWTATFVHAAHFAVPIALGFLLWLRSRALFWRFSLALLLTSYVGLLVYWRYPAAPPWLASDLGEFAPQSVWRILGSTSGQFPATVPIGWAYQHFAGNEVAAMPSLHGALALLAALTVWRTFPRWTPLALAYAVVMDLSLVYLGEHYVVDVLIGAAVALGSFAVVWPAGAALARWWAATFPGPPHRSVARPRDPALPRWWEGVRAALVPGVPLAALLWLLWGPFGVRPAGTLAPQMLAGPLAPAPCVEEPGELLGDAEAVLAPAGAPAALFIADLTRASCYIVDPAGLIPLEEGRDLWLQGLERFVTWEAAGEPAPAAALTIVRRTGRPADVLKDPAAPGEHTYGVAVLVQGEVEVERVASLLTEAAARALPPLVMREGS